VLSREVPPFDSIKGDSSPYLGFGDILTNSLQLDQKLEIAIIEARNRIEKGFKECLKTQLEVPTQIDSIIKMMWDAGWDPTKGNVNLFTRDFGLVLCGSIIELYGGERIFRTEENMNHFSIFWRKSMFEVFPFHKVLKCLLSETGESMVSFVKGIKNETTIVDIEPEKHDDHRV